MLSPSPYRQIFLLSLPIIISNISVPLLGLVDTAVVGHLSDASYLAGVTLGATLFSFLFWGFGFLRMGTTGAVSQAAGAADWSAVTRLLQQGVLMALGIACLLLLFQFWLLPGGLSLLAEEGSARDQAALYAGVRIWSAPAVLVNYVLMGWFLAQKNSRFALQMLLLGNGINILLDLIFVMLLGWQVQGVAFASLIADYSVMAAGVWLALKRLAQLQSKWQWQAWIASEFKVLFRVNHQLMVRTWLLLGSMAYFTSRGAAFGSETLAANAILMQLIMMASYALDGYAHGAEALVGQAQGAKDYQKRNQIVWAGGVMSILTVFVISSGYIFWGDELIALLTDLDSVRQLAGDYLIWAAVIPVLAASGYLLDGVYIGMMRSDVMRNGMLVAFSAFVFLAWLLSDQGNQGLWSAFAGFMLLRSLFMALHFLRVFRRTA
ncbi:MATE family efflux transporter [Oceanospirillum sp.]|uniref:MATE family efflux transporter n=1 Tax=Oceanospirillum sp. TaxID=2021254 RepID=UPI003A94FEB9